MTCLSHRPRARIREERVETRVRVGCACCGTCSPVPPSSCAPSPLPPRGQAAPPRGHTRARRAEHAPSPRLPCWTLSDATVFSCELRGAHSHFPKPPAQCFSGADHSSRSPQPFQLRSRNPLNPDLSRCAHVCRPAGHGPAGVKYRKAQKSKAGSGIK